MWTSQESSMNVRWANGISAIIVSVAACAFGQWRSERPKITGVSHLRVYTSDPAKAEQVYVHDLGATKGADPQNTAGIRHYFNPTQFGEGPPLPKSPVSL